MSWLKGEEAEEYVAKRLIAQGWTIAARNYRRRGFEIDIITHRADRLLCVEVKARLSRQDNDPLLILGPHKVQRLQKGMLHWLQNQAESEVRNTEFWLCLVTRAERDRSMHWSRTAEWMRLDELARKND